VLTFLKDQCWPSVPDSTFAVFVEKYEDNLYIANELKWSDEMEDRVLTGWTILSMHMDIHLW
jgi:hypothetical protein